MCSRFINWLKTWEYGLVGPDRIVFGSWLVFFGIVTLVFLGGVWVHREVTCHDMRAQCSEYRMQGCQANYTETILVGYRVLCDCHVEFCPGQARFLQDIWWTIRGEKPAVTLNGCTVDPVVSAS